MLQRRAPFSTRRICLCDAVSAWQQSGGGDAARWRGGGICVASYFAAPLLPLATCHSSDKGAASKRIADSNLGQASVAESSVALVALKLDPLELRLALLFGP